MHLKIYLSILPILQPYHDQLTMRFNFQKDILPHILAIVLFFVVTVTFFGPVFFENKVLTQYDIRQHLGSSKELRDYRDATGEEGLWAGTMFSGMPAYLVNVHWSDGVVITMKKVMSLFLPHPVSNFFIAFVCYYILLLTFRVRPYLAMAGAIAFGLSSFMVVGLIAGHNARIGAIAFMPLVVAGIHLTFSGRRILGFGVTALGLAFHLRENHLQITYYLMIIVAGYGIMQMVVAFRAKQLADFFKTLGLLIPAAIIAAGTFFGQFWAINEYRRYSIRGPSELAVPSEGISEAKGLSKSYVFEFSNAIEEPLTLMIPNVLGGASSNYLFYDEQSETYKALANAGSNDVVNQLGQYTSAYWGPQRLAAPYYAGAVVCFLFMLGILFADKKYVWWLASLALLSVVLSWGDHFPAFNYFLFDNFPGYNMFRSVTFALVIILFAMPLLGALGVEKLLTEGWTKPVEKKFLWTLVIPGFCLLMALTGGFGSFMRAGDAELPTWFRTALRNDRMDLLRSDAWRSFWFAVVTGGVLFAVARKWLKEYFLAIGLTVLVLMDLTFVDKRYLTKDNFQRKRSTTFELTGASQAILNDKDYYRVYNLQGGMNDAETSYYHNSIGGYHGAKLRRYQDLVDSCIYKQTQQMIAGLRAGTLDFSTLGVLNMLNIRYIMYGAESGNVIPNQQANGPAWFVGSVEEVNSPSEELARVCEINSRTTAVIDKSKFAAWGSANTDSLATVQLTSHQPGTMKYETNSSSGGLVVFSEIYYPKGWVAFIDGKESPLLRVNYVLRGMTVPSGKHTVEMRFEPKPYMVGNKVTMASSWILLLIVAGCIGWSLKGSGAKA